MTASGPLRVIVVDDEPAIRRFLRTSLRAEGYDVVEEETGEAALTEIRRRAPDLIMLDLGAHDYVTKPFGVDELLARIRAALRHRLQQEGEKPVFRSGDLTVDLVRRIVSLHGTEVKLTPREYDLLRLL